MGDRAKMSGDEENFEGDDFYWSDDSDSDEVQTEHDLQAQIENKGISGDESEDEEDDEDGEESSEDEETGIKGMGKSFSDAFSRIIAKDTKRDSAPLSHYKAPIAKLEEERMEKKVRSVMQARKKQKLERGHLTPDQYSSISDEKRMKNTARKGVVKLFNAVNKHQKVLAKELTGQTNPRSDAVEKLSKDKFFEILQGDAAKPITQVAPKSANKLKDDIPAEKEKSTWSVFDDNYLLGNQKLRDWDKQTEEEQQMEREMEGEIETLYDEW